MRSEVHGASFAECHRSIRERGTTSASERELAGIREI